MRQEISPVQRNLNPRSNPVPKRAHKQPPKPSRVKRAAQKREPTYPMLVSPQQPRPWKAYPKVAQAKR